MLLKGSCLREFYPQAEMRYMIDADILIHDCDSEKSMRFLSGADSSCVRRGRYMMNTFVSVPGLL